MVKARLRGIPKRKRSRWSYFFWVGHRHSKNVQIATNKRHVLLGDDGCQFFSAVAETVTAQTQQLCGFAFIAVGHF